MLSKMYILIIIKRLLGIYDPIYDESNDAFDAMKFWLDKANKEQEELNELQHKSKTQQ